MLQNREGQRVPEVTFKARKDGDWHSFTSGDLFAGKTVIVFGLPGAFTPTCSSAHVPRYNELQPVFAANGVDDVVCISVNDGFVMEAWQKDEDAHRLTFVPDGNGEFTAGLGLLVDKRAVGFGERSWRYSMLVRDGVIERMFIEPEKPGDPFEVSDADTMLAHVAPGVSAPPAIVMFTKPGCGHCLRAKRALAEVGLDYDELAATPLRLRALSTAHTTPQIFVDGLHLGGADDLVAWLADR